MEPLSAGLWVFWVAATSVKDSYLWRIAGYRYIFLHGQYVLLAIAVQASVVLYHSSHCLVAGGGTLWRSNWFQEPRSLNTMNGRGTRMEDSQFLHPETSRLFQELSNLDHSSLSDNAERVQIKEALGAALSRLETPWETVLRIVFTQVGLLKPLSWFLRTN